MPLILRGCELSQYFNLINERDFLTTYIGLQIYVTYLQSNLILLALLSHTLCVYQWG